MIERHFFRDRLLKTFDFEFGYCIPHSKNSCEHIYEFPNLPPDLSKYLFKETYIYVNKNQELGKPSALLRTIGKLKMVISRYIVV